MTIGEHIRYIRIQKGMTQKQVADACGMADSAIRKYESGVMRPKLITVSRIAKALEVDPMVLTAGDVNYPITLTIPVDELKSTIDGLFGWDDVRNSISKSLDKLNPLGQQKAVERVEELTEIPRYQKAPQQPLQGPVPNDSETIPEESKNQSEAPTEPKDAPKQGGE